MTEKTLAEMSLGELSLALRAARDAYAAADYQEGLNDWAAARRAADERITLVNREIDRRLAALGHKVIEEEKRNG